MIYKRHYVQFNDLVFEGLEMIEDEESSTSFKYSDTEYTFKHGSYVPFKRNSMFAEMGEVSFTLNLRMKALPCDVRKFYPQFVITQLTRPGKLWAVQNNTLVWAYAFLSDYASSNEARRDHLKVDVTFSLPEGVWHKADKQRTFLAPHNVCDFMDCYHYKEINPCQTECCQCASVKGACDCCDCWDVSKEMALCYFDDFQSFYDKCDNGYHIVYDCEAAERYFGGLTNYFGQKFCSDCGAVYGLLYSDTEIPTSGIKITLHGSMKDPEIEINGNTNQIKGEYNGYLTIYADGSVYYKKECSDCDPSLVSVSEWVVPEGNEYGWEIHAGNNQIEIRPHNGCSLVCAYIEVDALTI